MNKRIVSSRKMVKNLDFFNHVLKFISRYPETRRNFIGSAKQTAYTTGGAIYGTIVAGPPGTLVGAVIGKLKIIWQM